MKRPLTLLTLTATLALAGCGLYTNIPAQIHVASVKPASLTYQKSDDDGFREIAVVPGEVTLIAEPGSIGVTFEEMKIDYLTDTSRQTFVPNSEIAPLNMRVSLRVESSNYPADPAGNAIDNSLVGNQTFVGRNTIVLPIVTRHVEDYGIKTAVNASAITAQIKLKGTDDAGFPQEIAVYVPITFHGAPGQGQAKP